MELDRIELPAGADDLGPSNLGPQMLVRLPNGYGASVIKPGARVELSVLAFTDRTNWRLVYDTPVTDDVVPVVDRGHLVGLLWQIADLPRRMEYVREDVRFVWKQDASAAYIHMYWEYDGGRRVDREPFELTNVYDYAAGEVTISTHEEFVDACETWFDELEPGELDNYRAHTKAGGIYAGR